MTTDIIIYIFFSRKWGVSSFIISQRLAYPGYNYVVVCLGAQLYLIFGNGMERIRHMVILWSYGNKIRKDE